MGGEELLGCAEVNLFHTPRAGPLEQGLEQARRNPVSRAPIACVDEHLAQRTLVVAEVEQRDGADDLALRDRDPEVARPVLVEGRDPLEVGLIL